MRRPFLLSFGAFVFVILVGHFFCSWSLLVIFILFFLFVILAGHLGKARSIQVCMLEGIEGKGNPC